MGAWSYAVFGDDTAYDALGDLMASTEIMDDMERYFDEVIQAEYVGYDEEHYALVSAAVMPIPVLVLSSKPGSEERIAALKAGAHGYVEKPYQLEECLAYEQALKI